MSDKERTPWPDRPDWAHEFSYRHWDKVHSNFRHLTTMASGSIVVIVAFMRDLPAGPAAGRWLVAAALAFLCIALLGGLVAQATITRLGPDGWTPPGMGGGDDLVGAASILLAAGGFFLGILCLAAFGVVHAVAG